MASLLQEMGSEWIYVGFYLLMREPVANGGSRDMGMKMYIRELKL